MYQKYHHIIQVIHNYRLKGLKNISVFNIVSGIQYSSLTNIRPRSLTLGPDLYSSGIILLTNSLTHVGIRSSTKNSGKILFYVKY